MSVAALRGTYPTQPLPEEAQAKLRRRRNVEILRARRQQSQGDDRPRRVKREACLKALRRSQSWMSTATLEAQLGLTGLGMTLCQLAKENLVQRRVGHIRNSHRMPLAEYHIL